MGKSKTQRTDKLRTAAKRYVIAEQAQNHIEQHNFDRLVAQGTIVKEAKQLLIEGDKYQAYRRLLMIEDIIRGGA